LFLDRDGTVLHEILYLHTAEETWLADGAEDVIAAANRHDAAVVIVTNQAGIGRGFYGWSDFAAVQEKMAAELERRGAAIDAVFACPFHAEAEPPFRHPDHPARKPNPGMLLRAGAELGLDMARSWIIGNYHTDLAAGRAAGCAGGVHLATGHGTEPDQAEKTRALESPRFNVTFAKAVGEAIGAVPFLTGN
jgi:D-glycero-D-manno-heptose 1,7-bisphosphate phosphatase